MSTSRNEARVATVAALGDPTRRALYRLIVRSSGPVGRDEAAEALGIPRPTAAFHLDKLAESGLVHVEFTRRSGASGPGAGRPAKFYRAAVTEVTASVPERQYDLAAEIMVDSLEALGMQSPPVQAALVESAHRRGRALAGAAPSLDEALEAIGYEPRAVPEGTVFDNCPFHQLALTHPATMCAANHSLVQGVLDERGENPDRARFAPGTAGCCVLIDAP